MLWRRLHGDSLRDTENSGAGSPALPAESVPTAASDFETAIGEKPACAAFPC